MQRKVTVSCVGEHGRNKAAESNTDQTYGVLAGSCLLSGLKKKDESRVVDAHCGLTEKSCCHWARCQRADATVQLHFVLPSDRMLACSSHTACMHEPCFGHTNIRYKHKGAYRQPCWIMLARAARIPIKGNVDGPPHIKRVALSTISWDEPQVGQARQSST